MPYSAPRVGLCKNTILGILIVRTGTYYTTAVVHVDHLKENDNSLKAERLLRTTGNLYSFIEKNEKMDPLALIDLMSIGTSLIKWENYLAAKVYFNL